MKDLLDKKIVLASHNKQKIEELELFMKPFDFCVYSAADFGLPEPEETGKTFQENAFIKAFSVASSVSLPSLADDSGLCIAALDEQPGVLSANWSFTDTGERDFSLAIQKVEAALSKVDAILPSQRKAKFVSVLCLAFPTGEADFFVGEVSGTIVTPPRGKFGFGYDPIFVPEGYDKTFGEMNQREKQTLSHRSRAFADFVAVYFK